ncbi:MAG TPA: nitrous oxide reductase accessory protein NosL [Chitinophagales bacterium]|nr:nitrous oxide reductase accessory protein NosL [Chitinophagales bacterium]
MKLSRLLILSLASIFVSCSAKQRPIQEGADACAFCKMTVMEKKYATEIVSVTGKVFVFDDAHCMQSFLEKNMIQRDDVKLILLTDYNNPENLLSIDQVVLFTSEQLKTPMNGQVIALSDTNALNVLLESMAGRSIPVHDWLP